MTARARLRGVTVSGLRSFFGHQPDGRRIRNRYSLRITRSQRPRVKRGLLARRQDLSIRRRAADPISARLSGPDRSAAVLAAQRCRGDEV
jgi:hypothetical protein